MFLSALKGLSFISGFDFKAVVRIAIITAVAIIVWKTWSHYESLLNTKLEKELLESSLQQEKEFSARIQESHKKEKEVVAHLRANLKSVLYENTEYKKRTHELEKENAEYKTWRSTIVNDTVDDRLRERENAIRQRIRKRESSG